MATRKKVLWLIKGLGLGGAEKLLVLALPHLDRERFDYEVAYFLPWKTALIPELQRAGVPVFCLDQRRSFDPRGLYRLVHLLRERRPDLLHMHLPYAGIAGRLATRLIRVPATVYTEHNVFERYHPLTALVHRNTYSWNDAVICVSEAVRHSVMAHCNVNGNVKLRTIYNGVNWEEIAAGSYKPAEVREEFGVPPRDRLVVTVASFTPKKRHEDLLQAAKTVLAKNCRVTFLLVGDGPLRTRMEHLADDLGIRHKVLFAGPRQDAVRIIAACDLFVLPSLYEALGIALLEAMALRRPIVATRVGGIPEVISDNVEGFLVDPCNPRMLADRILTVLSHRELQQRFSCNSTKRLERQFDVRKMVQQTEALYDEVLRGKGA